MNLLIFYKLLKKLRLIWVKGKSARRGAQFVSIGMPRTCWNSVPPRRQIYYRWGTPAYWSLVARSSMFYLFEFCLKNKIKAHTFWITSYNGINIFDSMSGQKGSLRCYEFSFCIDERDCLACSTDKSIHYSITPFHGSIKNIVLNIF